MEKELSIEETVEVLGLSADRITALIRDGKLVAVKHLVNTPHGKRQARFIKLSSIAEYVKSREVR